MKNKDKVLALYNYIAEVSKNLKSTKINITEEKWFDFLEKFPKYKDITFEYEKLDEKYFEKEESKLLQIKKPNFLKPLDIDKKLLEWIEGDWADYRSTLEVNEKIFVKNTENDSGKIVDISPEIEKKIEKELEKRNLWVKSS